MGRLRIELAAISLSFDCFFISSRVYVFLINIVLAFCRLLKVEFNAEFFMLDLTWTFAK